MGTPPSFGAPPSPLGPTRLKRSTFGPPVPTSSGTWLGRLHGVSPLCTTGERRDRRLNKVGSECRQATLKVTTTEPTAKVFSFSHCFRSEEIFRSSTPLQIASALRCLHHRFLQILLSSARPSMSSDRHATSDVHAASDLPRSSDLQFFRSPHCFRFLDVFRSRSNIDCSSCVELTGGPPVRWFVIED